MQCAIISPLSTAHPSIAWVFGFRYHFIVSATSHGWCSAHYYLLYSPRTSAHIHLPSEIVFNALSEPTLFSSTHAHTYAQLHMNIHKYIMIRIYTLGRFHGNIRTAQLNSEHKRTYIHSMCIHHTFFVWCVFTPFNVAQCASNLTNNRTKTLLIVSVSEWVNEFMIYTP